MKKPKLGQNFLIDEDACRHIAASLGDVSSRTVVEIGPGHGAITDLLAPRCARLHCIEFDPALARELAFRFRNDPHVTVHHADILTTDLSKLGSGIWNLESGPDPLSSKPLTTPPSPLAAALDILGNLPYYITSDILLHLFTFARQSILHRAVLMMQREVADRIASHPGSSDYGPLSAVTQLHAQVTNLFTLPPTAFNPPPTSIPRSSASTSPPASPSSASTPPTSKLSIASSAPASPRSVRPCPTTSARPAIPPPS